jgi:hypothetical protein
VQIENDVVHLRTSLVQLFALLQLNFEEVVQIIELKRFGGAPNGYPFAALCEFSARSKKLMNFQLSRYHFEIATSQSILFIIVIVQVQSTK